MKLVEGKYKDINDRIFEVRIEDGFAHVNLLDGPKFRAEKYPVTVGQIYIDQGFWHKIPYENIQNIQKKFNI